jgi:hypothetical protein
MLMLVTDVPPSGCIQSAGNKHIHSQVSCNQLELSCDGESSVEREYWVLKKLEGSKGIPQGHWFGREASYEGLVLELLSPSLHNLIHKHKSSTSAQSLILQCN